MVQGRREDYLDDPVMRAGLIPFWILPSFSYDVYSVRF